MTREHIIAGADGTPVLISETDTRQEIVSAVYVNETQGSPPAAGIIHPLAGPLRSPLQRSRLIG